MRLVRLLLYFGRDNLNIISDFGEGGGGGGGGERGGGE